MKIAARCRVRGGCGAMRAVWRSLASALLPLLLLLCTCALVLHFWSGPETRLRRGRRSGADPVHPGREVSGAFRALLAVPQPTRSGTSPKRNTTGDGLIEDAVFWGQKLEDEVWTGFGVEEARRWREQVHHGRVVALEPGCGRTSNRLATLSDGQRACVRYGINAEQVQGETLSYFLASLLGIRSVPPLALSRLDGAQWSRARPHMDALQWAPDSVVSLSKWVPDLSPAGVPGCLRRDGGGLRPDVRGRARAELLQLLQWSDLIVFDYITANFDRLVSNLFSLQWDARALDRDASNLLRTPQGALVLLDNEAGLVHGYRVLDMWEKYHSAALESLCVFRRRTARRLAELHRLRDAPARLLQLYRDSEPLATELGFLSDDHARILQDRITRVHEHIQRCKSKFTKL